jgi:plastocyanin
MNKSFAKSLSFISLVLCLLPLPLLAASVTGKVQVMKKGGRKALDSSEYAVVYLTSTDNALASKPSEKPIIINQKNKRFFPRLMPIVKGQMVHFFNQDELEHNVFSTAQDKSFDLGRYPKGDFRPVQYSETGNYKVYCNIHQKMILDIVVLDNHYFTVTDPDGKFNITDVPAGNYQLTAWHIYGGKSEQAITVADATLQIPAIEVVSTKIVRDVQKHKNKNGKKYKTKGRYRR